VTVLGDRKSKQGPLEYKTRDHNIWYVIGIADGTAGVSVDVSELLLVCVYVCVAGGGGDDVCLLTLSRQHAMMVSGLKQTRLPFFPL
jgi:hypothetical protein